MVPNRVRHQPRVPSDPLVMYRLGLALKERTIADLHWKLHRSHERTFELQRELLALKGNTPN